jgi:hypothetical protein
MVKMTGQRRKNALLAPDHFTWAGPSQKREDLRLGLMPKTVLVKLPIPSFIYKHLRARYCAQWLILRPKRQAAGASAGGKNLMSHLLRPAACTPEPNSPPRPFSRIARTAASCHNYQALAT